MKSQANTESKPVQDLRRMAMLLPEVEEGVSCNKSAFKAGQKSFLFVEINDESYNVMVKLVDSLSEAERRHKQQPECYKVGKHGWTTIVLPHSALFPAEMFERWVEESYRALVSRKLVALLPDTPEAAAKSTKSVGRTAATKKAKAGKAATKKAAPKKSASRKAVRKKG